MGVGSYKDATSCYGGGSAQSDSWQKAAKGTLVARASLSNAGSMLVAHGLTFFGYFKMINWLALKIDMIIDDFSSVKNKPYYIANNKIGFKNVHNCGWFPYILFTLLI